MREDSESAKPAIRSLCLGNICRSPLAEGAARAAFAEAGIDATLDSAGTGDWHVGHPPDRRAQAEARRRSEEHTSELQSLIRTSSAVFCLKKKNTKPHT